MVALWGPARHAFYVLDRLPSGLASRRKQARNRPGEPVAIVGYEIWLCLDHRGFASRQRRLMRNLERRCRPFIERDQLCGPQRFSHRCSRRLYGRLIFCSSSGVFIPRRGPIRCFVLALHRSERHRTSQPRPPWHVRSCWRDHRAMVRGDRTLACELIAPARRVQPAKRRRCKRPKSIVSVGAHRAEPWRPGRGAVAPLDYAARR